jgi:hypothetical protein
VALLGIRFFWGVTLFRRVFPDVLKYREVFEPSRRLEILAQQHEVKSQKNRIHRFFTSEPNICIALQSPDLRFS